nr:hypothetical protein B0A51_00357 [Rachicladosporium sp. CCFEE 5018]
MAAIFASPDIAAIVAAFPPPAPTRGQVTLLRSASGERLLNSEMLLERLDRLLRSSEHRVAISSLPSVLGLRQVDITSLLSTHETRLYYSNDRSHLISRTEVRHLLVDLGQICQRQFVDLAKWSQDRDISPGLTDGFDMPSHTGDDRVRYLFHQHVLLQAKETVAQEFERARPEKCDLTHFLPNIPRSILERVAKEFTMGDAKTASAENSRAGVVLVPAEWQGFQQQRKGDQVRARLERVVRAVIQTGFATVDEEDEGEDDNEIVHKVSTNQHSQVNPRLTTFRTAEHLIVIRQDLLDEAARLITASVKTVIHEQWAAKEVEPSSRIKVSSILTTMERLKMFNEHQAKDTKPEIAQEFGANHGHEYSPEITRELCTVILESPQRKSPVDKAATSIIDTLMREEQATFSTIAQNAILSPLQLYETGLTYIQDEALRDRNGTLALQLILKDHIRPALVQVTERCLCHDRRRVKDLQPFSSAIADEGITLDSLNAAVKILQKKQSIAFPSTKQLQDVQVQVLQKANKALIPNKSRDSDILQHFVWVQFAHHLAYFTPQRQPALFVSGGKDTTRMIKALRGLASDSDGVRRCESFCEGLKKGTAGTMEGGNVYRVAERNVEEIMSLWGYDSSRASSIQPDIDFPARHLRPEDAYTSPPRHHKPRSRSPLGRSDTVTASSSHQKGIASHNDRPRKRRPRSSSRRRHLRPPKHPRPWKKLLWVKQSYPDNYTDEATFLDALQRNPRLQPYEFWTLVGDSTVIVQHVCSVVVFVCCFVGIYRGRVSPNVLVGWASAGTVGGWGVGEWWESSARGKGGGAGTPVGLGLVGDFATGDDMDQDELSPTLDALPGTSTVPPSRTHSRHPSTTSPTLSPDLSPPTPDYSHWKPPPTHPRLQTLKSATLIYFSLLGLSPLLKSLTLSTSSDSIWALAAWLITLNVFTFDYSSPSPTPAHQTLDIEGLAGSAGEGKTYPASLSTNAALMASTVLASRLPSTTHVFSLTLFSISIFGLFPVFRRSLRTHSPQLHNYLTLLLVLTASASLGLVVGGENSGWGSAVGGMVLGSVCVAGAMGGAGWWLIGLQRFKNEIRGPWDPARPRIGREAWE